MTDTPSNKVLALRAVYHIHKMSKWYAGACMAFAAFVLPDIWGTLAELPTLERLALMALAIAAELALCLYAFKVYATQHFAQHMANAPTRAGLRELALDLFPDPNDAEGLLVHRVLKDRPKDLDEGTAWLCLIKRYKERRTKTPLRRSNPSCAPSKALRGPCSSPPAALWWPACGWAPNGKARSRHKRPAGFNTAGWRPGRW